MGQLVFQAALGGQVNLVGPNTASTYSINVPTTSGNMVTTGDTATVTSTMISGPLTAAVGGTAQSTYTTGDILYASASNTLSKLPVGSTAQVLTVSGGVPTWAAPGGGFLNWQSVQTSNFAATQGNAYPVNTTSGAITVTLPASPSAGNMVLVTDYAGTFATNNLTINPNGNKIFGNATNFTINQGRTALGIVYIDSTQGWIQWDTASGSALASYSIDGLLIAGGGAGGGNGGGGGGGFVEFTGATVNPGTSYVVTVGAGGTFNSSTAVGTNGGNTSVAGTTITAAVGGGGGNGALGSAGGSGGGAGGTAGTGGAGTSGQGFRGGNSGGTYSGSPGAGGGGASAAAADMGGGTTNGGNGKVWATNSTTYAGGGGGGAYNAGRGNGGTGGGGNGGGNGTAGTDGTTNLGGGGGGGYCNGNLGRNGGSGIAIIRYAGAQRGTGGTIVNAGGYTTHTFTTTGTYVA